MIKGQLPDPFAPLRVPGVGRTSGSHASTAEEGISFGSAFSASRVEDSRALGVLQALEESIKVVKSRQQREGGGGEDAGAETSPFSPASSSLSELPRPVEYFASIITAMTSQPVPTGSELLRLLSMTLPFVPSAVLQSRLVTAARAVGGELAKAIAARSQGAMGKGLFLSMVKWGLRCSLEVVRSHHEIHTWDGEGGGAHSVGIFCLVLSPYHLFASPLALPRWPRLSVRA